MKKLEGYEEGTLGAGIASLIYLLGIILVVCFAGVAVWIWRMALNCC